MISNLLLVSLFVIITVEIIRRLVKFLNYVNTIKRVPGPPSRPIIGNFLDIAGPPEHVWKYFRQLAKTYYPIYKMWNTYISTVGIMSPDDVEVILSSTKHLRKSRVYDFLHPWLGTGLLTSTGKKWLHRRKLLTPSFHFNILEGFTNVFVEESELLVARLDEECGKPYTDVVPIITQFTLHSICETAMGARLDERNEEAKQYVQSIYSMGQLILYRVTNPWFFSNVLYTLFSPKKSEEKKLIKTLHSFSKSVIREREINFQEIEDDDTSKTVNSKKRLALLDLLISAKNRGIPIDNEGIREEVDTFMFEGHDTTTASICFTLMLLANHPEIQEKVYEELQAVLKNQQPTQKDLQKLPYLEQVIKESLRLYPSVPLITRILDEEILTPSGYKLPANTYIHVHIFDLHRNPTIYPDPDKFDPERFAPANTQGRHPFAYVPFSAGPRNCIGQKYAMLELKSVISAIVSNFILKPIDSASSIELIVHLITKSKNGIKVKFERR